MGSLTKDKVIELAENTKKSKEVELDGDNEDKQEDTSH